MSEPRVIQGTDELNMVFSEDQITFLRADSEVWNQLVKFFDRGGTLSVWTGDLKREGANGKPKEIQIWT